MLPDTLFLDPNSYSPCLCTVRMDLTSKTFYFSDLKLLHKKPATYFYDVELHLYHNNKRLQLQVSYCVGQNKKMQNK